MHELMFKYGGGVTVEKTAGDLVTLAGPSLILDPQKSTKKDLTGDYFTIQSYFGHKWSESDGLFHHGIPITHNVKTRKFVEGLSEYVLPTVKSAFSDDESAIVSEIVLDMRKDYERWVAEQAQKSALGWSTGAGGVLRESDGWLKRWLIVETSLTPTPAEPRTSAMPIKSLLLETKEASITSRVRRIHDAYYARFEGWVADIFETYVIAQYDGNYYRIPYTDSEEVTFAPWNEWEEVEEKREWVDAKAFAMALKGKSAPAISGSLDLLILTHKSLTNQMEFHR